MIGEERVPRDDGLPVDEHRDSPGAHQELVECRLEMLLHSAGELEESVVRLGIGCVDVSDQPV